MRLSSLVLAAAITLTAPASAQDLERLQIEARELLAEALQQHTALRTVDDPAERRTLLEAIAEILTRIETEYAASDIGLSILMGESFGPLDPAEVRADLDALRAAEAEVAAAEAEAEACLAQVSLTCVIDDLVALVPEIGEDAGDDVTWPPRLAATVLENGASAIPADFATHSGSDAARAAVVDALARAGRFAELEEILTQSPLAVRTPQDADAVWREIARGLDDEPAFFLQTSPIQAGLAEVATRPAASSLVFSIGGPAAIGAMLEASGSPVETLRAALDSGQADTDGFSGAAALVALSRIGHHDTAVELARNGVVEVTAPVLYDLRESMTDAHRIDYLVAVIDVFGPRQDFEAVGAFWTVAGLGRPELVAEYHDVISSVMGVPNVADRTVRQARFAGIDAALLDASTVRDWVAGLPEPLANAEIREAFETGWLIGSSLRDEAHLDALASTIEREPDPGRRLDMATDAANDFSFEGRPDLAHELVERLGIFENIPEGEGLGRPATDRMLLLIAAASGDLDRLAAMAEAGLVSRNDYFELAWAVGEVLADAEDGDRHRAAMSRLLASAARDGQIGEFVSELSAYLPEDAPGIKRLLYRVSVTADPEVAAPILRHLYETYDPRIAESQDG
jgi:hypothetical protein